MSCSGAGRGRGWLNLNKDTSRPGGIPNSFHISDLDDSFISDLSLTSSQTAQYPRLLSLIEQLDPSDDGILLNQKLKNIIQSWSQECNTSAEVVDSFNYIYTKCLQDSDLATKLVSVVSCYSFITLEIHDQKIRSLFIGHIQNDFEGCRQLQYTNPSAFRNSIRMLGEFYHKARLADGRIIKFLAGPVIQYLEMLLDSSLPSDLELFTSQLYLNGASIKTDCSLKLEDILMRARHILATNLNLTPRCRLWLLLALDVVSNRFGLLPTNLQKFYQEQLGDKSMANFQGTHSALSVQTSHTNKSLDSYQSSVNVLQVTPPESTSPVNEQTNNSNDHFSTHKYASQNYNNLQSYNSQDFNSENNDLDKVKDNKSNANNREKMGRPILGAGARLQRNHSNTDDSSNSNWREHKSKENSGGRDDNQKKGANKGWSGKKGYHGSSNKNNKGWEHDDRFDTDY